MSLQSSLTLNHQHKLEKDDPVRRSKERCLLRGDNTTRHDSVLQHQQQCPMRERFTTDFSWVRFYEMVLKYFLALDLSV